MRLHISTFKVIACAAFLLLEGRGTSLLEAQQGDGTNVPFSISNLGGVSLTTTGAAATTTTGYASIQPASGNTAPSGVAIFGFHQNGILVSEASVPATWSMITGRIYAEVGGAVETGIAIANPNLQGANVSFYFTDSTGQNFGSGSTTIPPLGQIAGFLDQPPFNGRSPIAGSFTFTSDEPIGVIALRGLTNERGEFLLTTLPVTDLNIPASQAKIAFAHYADGGGWTTDIVLENPTDIAITGNIKFADQSGQIATVTVNNQTNNTFPYSIPPRSSIQLRTAGTSASTLSGAAQVSPDPINNAPAGVAIFSYRSGGITVTQAGVPAVSTVGNGNAYRLYAEASGDFADGAVGSVQTGIAVVNASKSAAVVTVEAYNLDGTSTGLTGSVPLPAQGQTAMFLNQLEGLASLPLPFKGILRVSSDAQLAIVGLRGRYNERGDFLITTTSSVDETAPLSPGNPPMYFPHFADSGGYTTQFVLFTGSSGQTASGTLRFFNQAGGTLPLSFTTPISPPSPVMALSGPSIGALQVREP
jgi:hypothetical protein